MGIILQIRWGLLLMALALLLAQARTQALGVDDFQARTFRDAKGKTLNYRLFVPKNYNAKEKYPLILFLHGSGERGSDNQKQVGYFGASVFGDDFTQALHPCFLVAPQCPDGDSWAAIRGTKEDGEAAKQPTEPLRLTLALLESLQKEFSIDANRLYLTGLSMGGYGTWDALSRRPGLFAAAVPICGGGDPATAKKFANTPLWGFHGGADPVVPSARSHHMMIALREAGGEPLFTEYPGVGHNSWEKAYREPELAEWLFRKRLPLPPLTKSAARDRPILAGKKSFSDRGLIVVWRANERNDKAIRDVTGNGNDLTLENGQMDIQRGNVLNFGDEQPLLTFTAKPDSGLDKAFTLAVWIRVDPGHYKAETILSIASGDGKSGCVISLETTHLLKFASFSSTTAGEGTGPLPPGWNHVAVLCVGNKIEAYLNGRSNGSSESGDATALREYFNTLKIGGDALGKGTFYGKMDDIRLYKRALTAAEIAALTGVKPSAQK